MGIKVSGEAMTGAGGGAGGAVDGIWTLYASSTWVYFLALVSISEKFIGGLFSKEKNKGY